MKRAKLLIAASGSDADILYASGFHAPDPFVFVGLPGSTSILLSDLEVDRGRREARVDHVVAWSEWEKIVQGRRKSRPTTAQVVAAYLHDLGVGAVDMSTSFSLHHARQFEAAGLRCRVCPEPFWPERETKSPAELRLLTAALAVAEAGMARGLEILRASTIRRDGFLRWRSAPLTSEVLRQEMEIAVLRAGGEARGNTIVAGGEQACDPHERGSGPLRARELIILDIFPRHARSGYYGDLTRTVLRGQASDAQHHLWQTCLDGQKSALRAMKPGTPGEAVHRTIKTTFADAGYPTEIHQGRWRGFFHGTGHGLGLDLHEYPRFAATTFRPGQVLTVEPGIYWPGLGGVRHEDVAVVTPHQARLLTRTEKPFEL